jgi:hypothetical protein
MMACHLTTSSTVYIECLQCFCEGEIGRAQKIEDVVDVALRVKVEREVFQCRTSV